MTPQETAKKPPCDESREAVLFRERAAALLKELDSIRTGGRALEPWNIAAQSLLAFEYARQTARQP